MEYSPSICSHHEALGLVFVTYWISGRRLEMRRCHFPGPSGFPALAAPSFVAALPGLRAPPSHPGTGRRGTSPVLEPRARRPGLVSAACDPAGWGLGGPPLPFVPLRRPAAPLRGALRATTTLRALCSPARALTCPGSQQLERRWAKLGLNSRRGAGESRTNSKHPPRAPGVCGRA